MVKYIDQAEAINAYCELRCQSTRDPVICRNCNEPIFAIPAADVQPVKHGKWTYQVLSVPGGKGQTYSKWRCSQCITKFKNRSNYCPNCGADMQEDGSAQKSGRRTEQRKTLIDNCIGCKYKNQDPNEDPCYRCRNSSEYVPEDFPETIPDADGWEHVCIPKKGSL